MQFSPQLVEVVQQHSDVHGTFLAARGFRLSEHRDPLAVRSEIEVRQAWIVDLPLQPQPWLARDEGIATQFATGSYSLKTLALHARERGITLRGRRLYVSTL